MLLKINIRTRADGLLAVDRFFRNGRAIIAACRSGFGARTFTFLGGYLLEESKVFLTDAEAIGPDVDDETAFAVVSESLKDVGLVVERVSVERYPDPETTNDPEARDVASRETEATEEVWDETRLPPLTTLDGWLKQLNPADLSEVARLAVNFAFPVFLGSHKLTRRVVSPDAESREYCRRRFSGDTHELFPRSRYYSVCQDASGEDNATLVAELNAYALPELTGLCVARRSENNANRVDIVFRGLPGQPNPLYLALRDEEVANRIIEGNPLAEQALKAFDPRLEDSVPDWEELALNLPCRVERVSIPGVLDLRLPEARYWLMRFYAEPPDDFYGACLAVLARTTPNPPFDFSKIPTDHWGHVAQLIGDRSFGGNAFTELLACYLRSLGVSGLVYPSARNDYVALIRNGTLSFFYGWNFVDYRGAGRPEKYRHLATEVEAFGGTTEFIDERVGENAGSVELRGNLLYNRKTREESYLLYAVLFSSDARAKHGGEIWVRGFHWFRRHISLRSVAFRAACEKCGFETDNKAQALASLSCPRCGYYGDL